MALRKLFTRREQEPNFLSKCQLAIKLSSFDELEKLCEARRLQYKGEHFQVVNLYINDSRELINKVIKAHQEKLITDEQAKKLIDIPIIKLNPNKDNRLGIEEGFIINWWLSYKIPKYFENPQYSHLFDSLDSKNSSYIVKGMLLDHKSKKISLDEALKILRAFFTEFDREILLDASGKQFTYELLEPLFAIVIYSADLEMVRKFTNKLIGIMPSGPDGRSEFFWQLMKFCDMANNLQDDKSKLVKEFLTILQKLFREIDFSVSEVSSEVRECLNIFFKEHILHNKIPSAKSIAYLQAKNFYAEMKIKSLEAQLAKLQAPSSKEKEEEKRENKEEESVSRPFASSPSVKKLFTPPNNIVIATAPEELDNKFQMQH